MLRHLRLQRLDRYLLRRFLGIYCANLVSFTLLFVLIDMIGHFEELARKTSGALELISTIASYYAAITPLIYCQVLGPVVSVSAALFTVTTLQRTNEFTPMLATGRSYQRTFAPVLVASAAIAGGVFLVQELWIPRTVRAIRAAVESREGNSKEKHVMHLDHANGNLIVLREYDRVTRRATGVDILPIGRTASGQSFIRAREAQYMVPAFATGESVPEYWLLRDGIVQEYSAQARLRLQPPAASQVEPRPALYKTFSELPIRPNLSPADIELRRDEAVYMTLAELRRKAQGSPDHTGWDMKYYSRFVYPLTNFILVFLGLPVIVYFGNRNIFFGALLSLAIATAYFVVNSVCQDLGIQGAIPVRVGAGLAPILFTAAGATFYRGMQS